MLILQINMISYISGNLEEKSEKYLVLDVSGIGYKIFASQETLKKVGESGEKVKIFCHLYVREDKIELYGAYSEEEIQFFEMFLGVAGIGPKAALNILSLGSIAEIQKAIKDYDINFLKKAGGLGEKRAEKLILELKGKLDFPESKNIEEKIDNKDITRALINLGYSKIEIAEAIKKMSGEATTLEDQTKEILKILAKNKK